MVGQDQIRSIWQACGLGTIDHITPTPSGMRNESYMVNGEWFLRLNTLDPGFAKFGNERVAYDLLADSGLPIPSVVVVDESRRIVPYDFIVLTRLPGVNAAESRDTLNAAQVQTLAREAGRSLARIHAHTFGGFDKLREIEHPRFPSWFDYFADYARRYMHPARQRGLLDDRIFRRLEDVLARAHELLAQVTQGVLVHSDFHYENILQQDGRLTGILDFEWALSGDPASDFVPAGERERVLPGSEPAFVEGYTSVRAFDEGHERRVAVYCLFLWVETILMHHDRGSPAGLQHAQAEVRRHLDLVERAL
jgi:aminoglycoside phosphotransferase (APT) family kinase protein